MFLFEEASAIPLWTALGTWAQVVVLIVTARFVWNYLQETAKMRKVAEEQLKKSQAQVALAYRQLEGQIRPALVARVENPVVGGAVRTQQIIELVNIGSGPALDIKLSAVRRGAFERWDDRVEPFERERLLFIEPSQVRQTSVRMRPVAGLGGIEILGDRAFRCEYRSLSGRTYSTIVDFEGNGTCVEDTRFFQYPEAD